VAALAMEYRGSAFQEASYDEVRKSLGKALIYPADHTLGNTLVEALVAKWKTEPDTTLNQDCAMGNCFGIFVDLNSDGVEEFVLVSTNLGWAFEQHDGEWRSIGRVWNQTPAGKAWQQVRDAVVRGEISAVTPQWHELSIGGRRFRVDADR
jgi:hypothetical protein